MDKKTYEIAGRIFHQKPLVLRQMKQLFELFNDSKLEGVIESDVESLMKLFAQKGAKFLAIVLIPDGMEIKNKNLSELEEFFEDVDLETFAQVVRDFFSFNNMLSLIQKMFEPMMREVKSEAQNG